MGGPFARVAAAAALAALFALAAPAAADGGKRRCPVCGQVFEPAVAVCPNDGTDLAAEGRPVEEGAAPAAPAEEETEEGGDAPKYKRQDLGGARQRADAEEAGYDDRRARLGEDRRGDEERRRKLREQREKEHAERDARLRAEFEGRRGRLWEGRRRRAAEEQRAAEGVASLKRQSLWGRGAPLTSVGVRVAWMGEGGDPGPVTSAELEVNLVKTAIRVGLSSSVGVRALPARDDLLFIEGVTLGAQLPWRFSPYLLARAGVGALASHRFGEDLAYVVRSLGAEAGLDCRILRWLVVTPSIGFVTYAIDSAHWYGFTAKLSVGF